MAKRLDAFTPKVMAKGTTGAPPSIVEDSVREVCIDLCLRAGVWEFTSLFDLQDNVGDYPLLIPEPARLVAVKSVSYLGRTYRPLPGASWCQCGTTRVFVPNLAQIFIEPAPTVADDVDPTCSVEMTLRPESDAVIVPDLLYDDYADAIAMGAAARLFMIPNQPWTNLAVSQRLMSLYEAAVTRGKNKVVLERTTGPLFATGSYF